MRLTPIEPSQPGRTEWWRYRCACGVFVNKRRREVEHGKVLSCGCLNREKRLARNTRHGGAARGKQHPLYAIWQQMIKRCGNPRDRSWRWYGARGIKVCARWRGSFEAFLTDVGERPPGRNGSRPLYTLDRINNDGDYEPGNVRWATESEQSRNRRSRWRHRYM